MNKRHKEIAAWAVANFEKWPTHECMTDADPDEIGCELAHYPEHSTLPVLRCRLGGAVITSTDYFYAKRGIK